MRQKDIRPSSKYLCRDGVVRSVIYIHMLDDGSLHVSWKSTKPRESGGESLAAFVKRGPVPVVDLKGRDREFFVSMVTGKLRQDVQEGLDSGPAAAWDPEEVKRVGRTKRPPKPRG